MEHGKFIVLEGPDGSGKTTQAERLVEILTDQGFKVIKVREPGQTPIGEQIRNLLLGNISICPITELMLFTASRVELIEKVIKPHLEQGYIVVCDRFLDSTFAYQGYGRGIVNEVLHVEKLINEMISVDLTFYFDVDPKVAKERLLLRSGKLDSFDTQNDDFKRNVRKGYETRAIMNRETTIPVNGNLSANEVTSNLLKWLGDNFFEQNKHLKIKR